MPPSGTLSPLQRGTGHETLFFRDPEVKEALVICSLGCLGFNNRLQGTSRISRIHLFLSIDGLKIVLISLNVSNSGFLFLLRMEALSVN